MVLWTFWCAATARRARHHFSKVHTVVGDEDAGAPPADQGAAAPPADQGGDGGGNEN